MCLILKWCLVYDLVFLSPLLFFPTVSLSLSDFNNYVQNSVEIYVEQHFIFRNISGINKK